jgi:hypothetical protein
MVVAMQKFNRYDPLGGIRDLSPDNPGNGKDGELQNLWLLRELPGTGRGNGPFTCFSTVYRYYEGDFFTLSRETGRRVAGHRLLADVNPTDVYRNISLAESSPVISW